MKPRKPCDDLVEAPSASVHAVTVAVVRFLLSTSKPLALMLCISSSLLPTACIATNVQSQPISTSLLAASVVVVVACSGYLRTSPTRVAGSASSSCLSRELGRVFLLSTSRERENARSFRSGIRLLVDLARLAASAVGHSHLARGHCTCVLPGNCWAS
ncbi:hypothetical protein GQ53DRAFT_170381 [Thozetella sp. PMI_491]|nr:hypothetical protein GQ53DRAFT_170381 [Thozetella sp. PMI_491]